MRSSISPPIHPRNYSPKSALSAAFNDEEGGEIKPEAVAEEDDVAQFIAKIERSEKAFQRQLSRSKVRAIRNFYETAVTQPPIPGTVLLFTPQKLRSSVGRWQRHWPFAGSGGKFPDH
jgi:hypothetical protein